MNTWLVTGATGLLGANAVRYLDGTQSVVGAARRRPRAMAAERFVEVDLSRPASRAGLVDRAGADLVLHAAALSSIEACEEAPALARELNVASSVDLARQAAAAGARFVFISTDAVFDGRRGDYREDDPTSPTTEYGRTKVAAEEAVLEAHPGAIVARVNFYGWSPSGRRSLAEFFHANLASGREVKGFTDICVSTLYVDELMRGLAELARVGASGVVHVASSEPVTKFEFGRALARTFGFPEDLVQPALSTDVLAHARGSNLSLDVARFAELTGTTLAGQDEGLAALRTGYDLGVPSVVAGFATD